MADFKKDSLIDNYNRIVRAKNQRLNENIADINSKQKVKETIERGYDEMMKIKDMIGADEALNALVQALDDQVVMNAVEYIKRVHGMNDNGEDASDYDGSEEERKRKWDGYDDDYRSQQM